MTEDDLERRLRAALAGRAERVEPGLSGPDLRAHAAVVKRPVARFAAPALAAAAVVVVALATQTVGHDGSHHPHREQPGHSVITGTPLPTPTRDTSPAPASPPTVPHPARTHRPTPARSSTRVPPAPSTSLWPTSPTSPTTAASLPPRSPARASSAGRTAPPRAQPSATTTHP